MVEAAPSRILLVEDDDNLRGAVSRVLDAADYVVTACATAEEAWEAQRALGFGVVLADWMLPGASGLELTGWIRAEPEGDGVAIVVMTAHGTAADLEAVLDAGATDYLLKPVDPPLLLSRLRIAQRHAAELMRRKQSELALRKSEGDYLALLSVLPDWVVRLDGGGKVLDAFPEAERFGLLLERGTSLDEALPRDFARSFGQARARLMRGARLQPLEQHLETPEGSKDLEVRFVGSGDDELVAIIRDVTEVKQAQAKLLLAQVIQARETEHLKISRELHDHVGQMLTVMKMECDWLTQRSTDPEQVVRSAANMAEKIDQTAAGVRNLAYGLRPATLDDLGLGPALQALLTEIRARSGITVEAELGGMPEALDAERAITLYRIAQEALTNVIRHSGAKKTHLSIRAEGATLVLEIRDDGAGIPARRLGDVRSLGLAGMRERASLVGGSLELTTDEGTGTVVTARIPLVNKAKRKGMGAR